MFENMDTDRSSDTITFEELQLMDAVRLQSSFP